MIQQAAHPLGAAPAPPTSHRLLRGLIEHNCFYVLSVLLMLYGCYRLMHSSLIDGEDFERTLKTLLVLQGYEMLVILSAAAIALRFRILGDAVTLFVIELALLLDPTFFANSFYTMPTSEGAWTNVICFALVPLKLLILAAALRLQLAPRALGAFMVAAAAVYLGEGQLSTPSLGLSEAGAFYLLSWVPLLIVLLLPALCEMLVPTTDFPFRVTPPQHRFLNLIIPIFALLLPVAHFIESARVHEENLRLYIFHLAPIALAAGWIGFRASRSADFKTRIAWLDVCVFIALLFSLRAINFDTLPSSKLSGYPRHSDLAPDFLEQNIPLIFCTTIAFCLYGALWLKMHRPAFVARLVALTLFVLIQLVWGWTGWTLGAQWTVGIAGEWLTWLIEHRRYAWGLIWLAIAVVAVRKPSAFLFFFAVFPPLVYAAKWLPGGRENYIAEFFEAAIAIMLIGHHLWSKTEERNARVILALTLAVVASSRLIYFPSPGTVTVAAITMLGLFCTGLRLGYGGYCLIALGIAGLMALLGAEEAANRVADSLLGIGAGILLLITGLIVTFNKAWILYGLNALLQRFAPPRLPQPAAAAAVSDPYQEELDAEGLDSHRIPEPYDEDEKI